MPDTSATENMMQAEIVELLARLTQLRQHLVEARAAIEPLEEGLNTAFNEYQNALSPINRRIASLKADIKKINHRIKTADLPPDGFGGFGDSLSPSVSGLTSQPVFTEAITDPEAREKKELFTHLSWVLNPEFNVEGEELMGDLQGRCSDPATRLADLLERLPWGPAWTSTGPNEELAVQYRRLKTWERALTDQLRTANQAAEQLKKDRRYKLWEQRERGATAWQDFIRQVAEQEQEHLKELQAQLEELSQESKRRLSEQNT